MILAVRDREPASIDALALADAGAKTIEAAGPGDAGAWRTKRASKYRYSWDD